MRKNEGITLIALIITVIILVILTGITINNVMKSNLFGLARGAVENYLEAGQREQEAIDEILAYLGGTEKLDTTEIDKKLVLQDQISYQDSKEELENPDRGFYKPIDIYLTGNSFNEKDGDLQGRCNSIKEKKIKLINLQFSLDELSGNVNGTRR